jgi:septal ring-binding cell division protein DamX
MKNLDKALLLTAIIFFASCETGVKNKTTANDMNNKASSSGIIKEKTGVNSYSKSSGGEKSEIKRIFSNSAVPGYYLQVGHFEDKKPDLSFINKMKRSGLPYDIVEKYQDGRPHYYALVGPYRSYNEAKRVEDKGRAKSISYGTFIVKTVRP